MKAHEKIKWQDLERLVRTVAEAKFGATARAEDIAGVKCDCVIRLNDGSVVLVEISKETSLDKLRTDLAKFGVLRPYFFQKNIFPKCFFITLDEPTPSLIQSGQSSFVQVYSVGQFFDALLGLHRYAYARSKLPFGSAVDLYSGEPDRNRYVPVTYVSESGESYTVARMASELVAGRTIVLIGDYGSGKSRCTQEVFEALIETQRQHYRNPIAINLRENWGLKRAQEMLTRHFTDLGLTDVLDQALKVAYAPATIYLLDGFDEIGAQTWSDDPTKLVDIRKQSLVGVKDLVTQAKGGILITGREHYFNNDAELITCLGLGQKNPLFLRCNQQLTDEQFSELLGRSPSVLPAWMPKKPLIANIARDIEPAVLDSFFKTSSGEIDFWNLLVDAFCEREARINPILDPAIIRSLLTKIGRLTRATKSALGPISIKQINEAFEQTTGRPPTDESAIVLQRLPGLSRIGAESLDRQFADIFILDGLKAEDTLELFAQGAPDELDECWVNPIENFGAYFVSARLGANCQVGTATAFIKRNVQKNNKVLLSDLLSGLLQLDFEDIDLGGQSFFGGKFFQVALGSTAIRNLTFVDCFFDHLDITDSEPRGVFLSDCVVMRLSGITSSEHAPSWFKNCLVEVYQSVETLSAIREAGLSVSQTFLLSSLRKLFLQPGGGRKESSMYKGYGDSTTKKTCEKVMQLLIRERFCEKFKGQSEPIFVPNRSLTGRVQAIMSQMTTSKDTLWLQVSRMDKELNTQ
ncbi:hypothetical protein ZRA01_21160 [Zoogloea ramigera]|uniref:NACHT domain-containing protein n=1 Tax=Zoogloea ramigera TaxID=350 RepID=A0A4Y4CXM7_ZOORA|nr:hypothetical protein [Zoogloea ramigera]GEC96043.1 hypothetical protein ZRA01_21160 [Zoogloea ramigera]